LHYTLLKDDTSDKEVEISVPRSELAELIEDETEKLSKEIKVDGFRKGRVPRTLIMNRYKDTLKAQAMDQLVKRAYLALLRDKNWQPASQAELLNIEEADTIKLRLHVEVIPEFNVDNYLNIEVYKERPLSDEFLLEQGINALREQHAVIAEADRPAVVDDLVTADIEIKEGAQSSKETDQIIRVGDRSLPDELNRSLVGAKKNQHIEVQAGDKSYILLVKKIEERNLPQIDSDFAKKMNLDSVEDLKKKLLENMKQHEEKRIEEGLKESISKVLLERIRFEVPKTLIQNEYAKILKEYNLPDSDSNKERFWTIAENRIRFNLILDKITRKENLQVAESEIIDLVTRLGMKLTDQNRGDVIDYLGGMLNREKIMDFLYKNAKISEKSRILTPKEVANDTHSLRH
jgi:trigger factor